MKIYKLFLLSVGLMLCLSSCSVVRQSTYSPRAVEHNLCMEDFEYLGQTEVSVEYRKYLGVFRTIDVINGQKYDGKKVVYTKLPGCNSLVLNRAAYKVWEEYPEADYLVVSRSQRSIERLLLGSEIKVSAKVKAYKLK